jgi:hypothetical protein
VFVSRGDLPEKEVGLGRNPTAVWTRAGLLGAWTQEASVLLLKPGVDQPEIVDRDGAFPSMAALSNGSVAVAWESKGAIVIRVVH